MSLDISTNSDRGLVSKQARVHSLLILQFFILTGYLLSPCLTLSENITINLSSRGKILISGDLFQTQYLNNISEQAKMRCK